MDVGKSFSFVFKDPQWVQKVLIAGVVGVLSFLIVPAFVLFGYALQLIRNTMAGEENPLPEWQDFGTFLVDGLKAFVVMLIYFVPGIVLSMLSGIDGIGGLFYLLSMIYFLAVQIAVPAALGLYLATNDIGASLKFQEVLNTVQANLGDFIVVWLLGIVASMIGGLGIIACGIGLLFTLPYSIFVRSHLWAQLLLKVQRGVPAIEAPSV